MKIETHNPKFHPGDKVLRLVERFGKLPVIHLATVQYCEYDQKSQEWSYALNGFDFLYKENELDYFDMHPTCTGLKFTYDTDYLGKDK